MTYVLSDLPYALDALQPVVSAATLETHWGKHHRSYVDKTNALAAEGGLADIPLEALIRQAGLPREASPKLFNNAAQAWNHGFYWRSMTPDYAAPDGDLHRAIGEAFGSVEDLKARFVTEGTEHFASGWTWLVHQDEGLSVTSTHDAGTAITRQGVTPLLVCDVWEHAYYLDYRQDRKGYLERWFDQVIDWRFAAAQFDSATAGSPGWTYPAPT